MRCFYLNEPLYPQMQMTEIEYELFQTSYVRRLKFLAHFGAGSLVTPVVHSRLEHTLGVWKLACYFFPENNKLRISAILHDIGHLPFSHAVEENLGFNHHHFTEKYISSFEIKDILSKYGYNPEEIIAYLNDSSPLTGYDNVLGLDHLDSFFRDTYMAGLASLKPRDILKKLSCSEKGIVTDEETAMYLLELIATDHELFLSPHLLAVDKILSEAIRLHSREAETRLSDFVLLTDHEVITMLLKSSSKRVKRLIELLLFKPHNITIEETFSNNAALKLKVRKLYKKSPLVNGKPFLESSKSIAIRKRLQMLKKEYYLNI
ncbi:HD domain-containing protein [Lederbergia wuyishanensis]|uniref:HD superfamily phosphohydrolase n=1 Tax=Lederbergia wuyishanensis TaxID=1347903 RepID=A0ABU0D3S4_9BACI|nr:HD domain-containing protein [Lederbergia wuyishanensis]MCJ8007817.1 HD domain-containing protein [Lederbergia wuyishanensis]MDQ0343018.1 HD superfamily phosphohydrolase [Lederbergia wuyishanensis]